MRSLHWTVQVQTTQKHIATQISLKAQFPTPILVELAGTLPPTSQREARDSTIITIFKRAGKMGANPCKAEGSRQGKSLHIWKNKLMISSGTNGKQMLWLVISQSDLKKDPLTFWQWCFRLLLSKLYYWKQSKKFNVSHIWYNAPSQGNWGSFSHYHLYF